MLTHANCTESEWTGNGGPTGHYLLYVYVLWRFRCFIDPPQGRKKKRFIDKKNAHTFHLVSRSQSDPLYGQPEESQYVLKPETVNTFVHMYSCWSTNSIGACYVGMYSVYCILGNFCAIIFRVVNFSWSGVIHENILTAMSKKTWSQHSSSSAIPERLRTW